LQYITLKKLVDNESSNSAHKHHINAITDNDDNNVIDVAADDNITNNADLEYICNNVFNENVIIQDQPDSNSIEKTTKEWILNYYNVYFVKL
jgi:hypothetical protein